MGHPDAATLIEAVQAFLADIELQLDGRTAFHAKVAGNALAVVVRELRQPGASPLAEFGGTAALCEALRAGRADAATPGLLDALAAATCAQLRIDNPRYSTLSRLEEP